MFHSRTERAFHSCGAYGIDTSRCYTAHHSWLSGYGDRDMDTIFKLNRAVGGETARARDSFTTNQAACRDSVGEREEAALLGGIRRGGKRGYEQLVRQYGRMMLAVARRLLR